METDDDMFDSWTTRVARKINEVAGAASFLGNNKTLQRAYHEFLRNGEFQQAKERCDRALDEDYKNASAYVVMLMADLQVRSLEELANRNEPFDQNESYKKAMDYGNQSLKGMLRGYVDNIKKRNEYNRKLAIYNKAVNAMDKASTEEEYNAAADLFASIEGFDNESQLLQECRKKTIESKITQSMLKQSKKHKKRQLKPTRKPSPYWSLSKVGRMRNNECIAYGKRSRILSKKHTLPQRSA